MKPNKYRGPIDRVFGYVMNNKAVSRAEIRANFAYDYSMTAIKSTIDYLINKRVFEEKDGVIKLNSEIIK